MWLMLLIAVIQTEALWFEETPVVTPENPFVFVGENLTLTCEEMQPSSRGNVSGYMYFKRGARRIPDGYTRVKSERSIELMYTVLSGEDDGSYSCYMNETLLGQQTVTVEHRPQPVSREDVRVLVEDWRAMNVSWHVGDHWLHADLVKSNLRWRIKDSYQNCPDKVYTNNFTYKCLWKEHDGRNSFKNVPYWIQIVLQVSNKSGSEMNRSQSEEFFIDTKQYVKPAAVVNLTAHKVLSRSVCVSWQLTLPSSIRDVQHKVLFSAHHQLQRNVTTRESHTCVDDLSPYTEYTVNVSTVPLERESPQGSESDFTQLKLTTKQDVPSEAPVVVPGCFHFSPCHNYAPCVLTIYWQAVPKENSNGKIIIYNINVTIRGGTDTESYQVNGSLRSLELRDARPGGYIVTLSATTEAGPSQKNTTIYIPDFASKPAYPTPVLVEGEKDLIYINWTPPREVEVINYTLFYCNTSKIQHSCLLHEDLQWIELPADRTHHVMKVPNPDNIMTGVSIRVKKQNGQMSSGISWSVCTFNRNKEPGKPEHVVFSAEQPNFALEIEWDTPGCRAGEPYILYYIAQYCQGTTSACTGNMKNENISNSKTRHTITDLEVGMSYRVVLRAVSRGGMGPGSDPLIAVVDYSGLSSVQIAGIAVGAAFFSTFVIVGIVFCVRRIHRGIRTFKLPIDVPGIDNKDTFVPPILPSYNLAKIEDKPGRTKTMPTEAGDGSESQDKVVEENVSHVYSRNTSTSESTWSDNSHTLLLHNREVTRKERDIVQPPSTSATTQFEHESNMKSCDGGIITPKVDSSTVPIGSVDINTWKHLGNIDKKSGSSKNDLATRILNGSQQVSSKEFDNLGYRSMDELETSDSTSAASYSRVGGCLLYPDLKKKTTVADLQKEDLGYVTGPCGNYNPT